MIATANGYGTHFPKIWGPIKEFVEYAPTCSAWSLDLGCSWGTHSLAAIKAGARVVACDLDAKHLRELSAHVPPHLRLNLRIRRGAFQDIALPKNSIGAILAANVFRFMVGDVIDRAIAKMFDLLVAGGKVFVVTQPPPPEDACISALSWIGLLGSVPIRMPKKSNQFLDVETISRLFKNAGFKIERAEYRRGNFDRQKLTTLVARKLVR